MWQNYNVFLNYYSVIISHWQKLRYIDVFLLVDSPYLNFFPLYVMEIWSAILKQEKTQFFEETATCWSTNLSLVEQWVQL